VASVIGITFTEEDLRGLLGAQGGERAIERLVDAALIAPAGDGTWRFAHPLIHDTAYAGLLASRRRLLHTRLADLIAGKPPIVVPLGLIATHRAAAGDAARALPLLREAAATAMAVGAAAEASGFWRAAAALSAGDDPPGAATDMAQAAAALVAAQAVREITPEAATAEPVPPEPAPPERSPSGRSG